MLKEEKKKKKKKNAFFTGKQPKLCCKKTKIRSTLVRTIGRGKTKAKNYGRTTNTTQNSKSLTVMSFYGLCFCVGRATSAVLQY
jgi:hypothetical protein